MIYTQLHRILVLETIVSLWGRVFSASEISEKLQFLIQRSEKTSTVLD